MVTTITLVMSINIHSPKNNYFFVMRVFKICSFRKFQICMMTMLTIVIML